MDIWLFKDSLNLRILVQKLILEKVNPKETKEREEGLRLDDEEVNRRYSIDNSKEEDKD